MLGIEDRSQQERQPLTTIRELPRCIAETVLITEAAELAEVETTGGLDDGMNIYSLVASRKTNTWERKSMRRENKKCPTGFDISYYKMMSVWD